MADPLGRAMLDFQRGRHRGNCFHRDGDTVWDANLYGFYFRPPGSWDDSLCDLLDSLRGPVLDAGCGTGQQSKYLQERGCEVVAVDVSPHAVCAARERGVVDARVMDVFDLSFPLDRFESALVKGTQVGLAGSLPGVRSFLSDLASVTAEGGVAIVDSYDPADLDEAFPGYRSDPREGLARRTFHVEYERPTQEGWIREVGSTLDFLLFDPVRLREATEGLPWTVTDVRPKGDYYQAVLKQ